MQLQKIEGAPRRRFMTFMVYIRDVNKAKPNHPIRFQAFLSNEDLGDSLDSVEALIKKHEDFEKSLAAQEEKIKALDEFATKLIEGGHYAAEDVAHRRGSVSFLQGHRQKVEHFGYFNTPPACFPV